MTERFMIDKRAILDTPYAIRDNFELLNQEEVCDLLNEQHEQIEQLKEQLSEAKTDEKQLGISFMGYKMKLIEVLQNHLDGWRGVYNPIDESIIVEICVVKSIAEDLGVDLE